MVDERQSFYSRGSARENRIPCSGTRTIPQMRCVIVTAPVSRASASNIAQERLDTARRVQQSSAFAWLFLALRLSLRGSAISSARLWTLPSHLSVTRAHLGTMRSHLGLARPWSHLMRRVTGTSGSGSFGGMHFGLVSPGGSLISGLELVPVCTTVSCPCCLITCSCSLTITFSYVPGFVSTFSSSRFSSGSFSGLSGACALTIKFGCVPGFVFTFACTPSGCCAGSLLAALALPHAFVLVE